MVRRMTPAQLKAAVQRAQREQKRTVDNYNREARKYNAAVKKAVTDLNREKREQKQAIDRHNRAVRTYNTKARAHNLEVESQRRRINQEMARLTSRPAGTAFITYRSTTTRFLETYTFAESELDSSPGPSAVDQFVLHLASDEAANSVYLVNALEGDGAPEDDLAENELRAPSMTAELARFGADLVDRWTGALYALSPENPDAARHFCTSAREVMIAMLDSSAPDIDVKGSDGDCELTDRGVPTRRAKINYLLSRRGVSASLTDVVNEDVTNVLALFRTFNDGTHGHAGRFSITELTAIRTRVESAIGFIYQIVGGSEAR